MVKDFINGNFIDDAEKMRDFKVLTKEEFLKSYSYLTEEYDNTMKIFRNSSRRIKLKIQEEMR